MSLKPPPGLVLLGRFGAPHGLAGEIRLQSFAAEPLAIAAYGPLRDRSGARRFTLSRVRAHGKDMLVARVEGVTSRDAAGQLGISTCRERCPQPGKMMKAADFHVPLPALPFASAGENTGRGRRQ